MNPQMMKQQQQANALRGGPQMPPQQGGMAPQRAPQQGGGMPQQGQQPADPRLMKAMSEGLL